MNYFLTMHSLSFPPSCFPNLSINGRKIQSLVKRKHKLALDKYSKSSKEEDEFYTKKVYGLRIKWKKTASRSTSQNSWFLLRERERVGREKQALVENRIASKNFFFCARSREHQPNFHFNYIKSVVAKHLAGLFQSFVGLLSTSVLFSAT